MQSTIEKAISTALVSHFTPSLMASATLEEILVEREDLAAELVEEILGSATNPTKAQTLLVGPRGIGKTHLVTVVYHRVRAATPPHLCIAWLREEEYGVVSWLDLLLRIFRSLEEEYPGTTPRGELEPLYGLPASVAEREAQTLLQNYLAGRTLWLIVENLDAIFKDIKETGQRKWRSWIQEHPVVTTLATMPGLFAGISGRNVPFYGFFRTEHLQPLDVDGAVLLLQKLAHLRGDEELASFIATPAGHARVRAVHHLAGGNFRIYVVFASFLKRASLDELVGPFLQLLDELTPYYQSQLAALSAQQRKIIEVLCDYRAAMPVKALASRGFMSATTASSQLVELKERGYVVAHTRGRESLYELREPLLRLCLEVKKQRGEPVALLIEFLRLWYRREELTHHLERCAPEAVWEREYLMRALAEKEKETEDPHAAACERDLDDAIDKNDFEKAKRIAEELIEIRANPWDWARYGQCLIHLKDYDKSLDASNHAIDLDEKYDSAWLLRSASLSFIGDYVQALESVDKALEISYSSVNMFTKGLVFRSMGKNREAIKWFNKSIRKKKSDDVIYVKGELQMGMGDLENAQKNFRILERRGFDPLELLPAIANVSDALKDHDKAIEYWQKLLKLQQKPENYIRLAYSSLKARRFPLALTSANRAIELKGRASELTFYRAHALLALELEEGFEALQSSLSVALWELNTLLAETIFLLETLYFVFESKPDVSLWTPRWARLVSIFESEKKAPVLSSALADIAKQIAQIVSLEREENAATPAKSEVRPQARKALEWSRSWLEVFDSTAPGEYASLHLAARLSAAAIEVAVSGDDRSLLDLPSEERAIVREILGEGTVATDIPLPFSS